MELRRQMKIKILVIIKYNDWFVRFFFGWTNILEKKNLSKRFDEFVIEICNFLVCLIHFDVSDEDFYCQIHNRNKNVTEKKKKNDWAHMSRTYVALFQ